MVSEGDGVIFVAGLDGLSAQDVQEAAAVDPAFPVSEIRAELLGSVHSEVDR